jgi:hypothetical protein
LRFACVTRLVGCQLLLILIYELLLLLNGLLVLLNIPLVALDIILGAGAARTGLRKSNGTESQRSCQNQAQFISHVVGLLLFISTRFYGMSC